MLAEREVWIRIKELETELKKPTVLRRELLESLKKDCPCFLRGKTEEDIVRFLKSLKKAEHIEVLEYYDQPYSTHTDAYRTAPRSDDHFLLRYFWWKPLDAFGFGKVVTLVGIITAAIVSFWPNGVASKIVQILFG